MFWVEICREDYFWSSLARIMYKVMMLCNDAYKSVQGRRMTRVYWVLRIFSWVSTHNFTRVSSHFRCRSSHNRANKKIFEVSLSVASPSLHLRITKGIPSLLLSFFSVVRLNKFNWSLSLQDFKMQRIVAFVLLICALCFVDNIPPVSFTC